MANRVDFRQGVPLNIQVLAEPALETLARRVGDVLAGHGLIGPCNLAGRQVADGSWRFYEINARFTMLVAARAALGFNEVDAAWRHFVERDDVGDSLSVRHGFAASQFFAETLISEGDLARLRETGRWRAGD